MTIEELLNQLSEKADLKDISLPNTRDTWRRLGERDEFAELAFASESDKERFLSEWASQNDYNNI